MRHDDYMGDRLAACGTCNQLKFCHQTNDLGELCDACAILSPVNNQAVTDKLRALAQWCQYHGATCEILHECNTLRLYVDGTPRQLMRPTFRQVRELILGDAA